MFLALEHRHAIKMRPNAAGEQSVARVEKMLRRDRRADLGRCGRNEVDCFAGRHVLEYDRERRKVAHDARERSLDEYTLAVEDVDVGTGRFAVNEERESVTLHGAEGRI